MQSLIDSLCCLCLSACSSGTREQWFRGRQSLVSRDWRVCRSIREVRLKVSGSVFLLWSFSISKATSLSISIPTALSISLSVFIPISIHLYLHSTSTGPLASPYLSLEDKGFMPARCPVQEAQHWELVLQKSRALLELNLHPSSCG